VRITAVKGIGKLKKGVKPAIPPKLTRLQALLRKCAYDRYDPLAAPSKRGLAKTDLAFKGLGAGHTAVVRWTPGEKKGGDVLLEVTLDETVGDAKHKVASMKVRLADGASYVIKVPGAYADGDLLLVVTVSRAGFAEPQPRGE
jgi:hypothetical protein